MMDYMDLVQTTPSDERCMQVGEDNYLKFSRIEAHAYISQLKRSFGSPPAGSRFCIVRCPHDAGTYLDIRYWYDDEEQAHVEYMIEIERGTDKWDEEALQELEANDYPLIAKVINIKRTA